MERYSLLEKIGSTAHCTYYNAENILTREPLTLKKLKAKHEWEKLLNCQQIALMKDTSNRQVTRLLEIVKHKQHFYLVHPRLGENLQAILKSRKFEAKEVLAMGVQMVQAVFELVKRKFIVDELSLEMFFMNNKQIKLGIIPAYTDGSRDSDYRYLAPERLTAKQQTEKSLVFALGCVLSELLTGKQLISASNRKEYVSQLNNLHPDEQLQSVFNDQTTKDIKKSLPKLLKPSNFEPFVEIIEMMTRLNPFERIALQEVQVRLKHLHTKHTEPIGRNRSDLVQAIERASNTQRLSPLEVTLPRIPPKVLRTEVSEAESTSGMVETRSYRLHRSLKKVRRNPEKHRYNQPFGINFRPCCSIKLNHRDMARSKLTHYACSDMRSSNSCLSEHLFD